MEVCGWFNGYGGDIDNDFFFEPESSCKIALKLFFIQCFFEAQTIFTTIPNDTALMQVEVVNFTELNSYAVSYCIANFDTGVPVPWCVYTNQSLEHFMCGLNRNDSDHNITIEQLHIFRCSVDFVKLPIYYGLTVLKLNVCSLGNEDMRHLSRVLPDLSSLKELSSLTVIKVTITLPN